MVIKSIMFNQQQEGNVKEWWIFILQTQFFQHILIIYNTTLLLLNPSYTSWDADPIHMLTKLLMQCYHTQMHSILTPESTFHLLGESMLVYSDSKRRHLPPQYRASHLSKGTPEHRWKQPVMTDMIICATDMVMFLQACSDWLYTGVCLITSSTTCRGYHRL